VSDSKKPGVAYWTTVALAVLLVGYPLSFGPACWISNYWQPSGEIVSAAYRPIINEWYNGPVWFRGVLESYVAIGANVSDIKPHQIQFHQPID
jgi:hypothetical protein